MHIYLIQIIYWIQNLQNRFHFQDHIAQQTDQHLPALHLQDPVLRTLHELHLRQRNVGQRTHQWQSFV